MSTKVVLKRSAASAEPIRWPSAEEHAYGSPEPEMVETGATRLRAQMSQQAAEIEALKAELEQTRQAAERRVQEAADRGRNEGNSAARQAMSERLESELAKAARLIDELASAGPKLRHRSEEDLVRLAVAIARRVLHREITVDPDALVGLVKAAFGRLDQREVIEARTDPATEPAMQRILKMLDSSRKIKLVIDASLRPGSLVLDTSRGYLDASVETQLDEIERGFIDIVGHKR
jgi:flagellar assembly protein FliH